MNQVEETLFREVNSLAGQSAAVDLVMLALSDHRLWILVGVIFLLFAFPIGVFCAFSVKEICLRVVKCLSHSLFLLLLKSHFSHVRKNGVFLAFFGFLCFVHPSARNDPSPRPSPRC